MSVRCVLAAIVLVALCISAQAEESAVGYYWLKKGVELYGNGSYEDALAAYQRTTELDPGNARAWLDMGEILTLLGSGDEGRAGLEKAVEVSERALLKDPRDDSAWRYRGAALISLGRMDEGRESFQKALEIYDGALRIDSGNSRALWYRAECLEGLDRLEEAAQAYERFIGLNPGDADAWISKGLVMMRLRRYDESADAFGRAADLIPASSSQRLSRAVELRASALSGDGVNGDPKRYGHIPSRLSSSLPSPEVSKSRAALLDPLTFMTENVKIGPPEPEGILDYDAYWQINQSTRADKTVVPIKRYKNMVYSFRRVPYYNG